MPTISQFYGIKIYIFYDDHNEPHIHAYYGGNEAGISIKSGKILSGDLPKNASKLVKQWIEEHKEELINDWELAKQHEKLNKIDPLE